jgi:hypothetical protein
MDYEVFQSLCLYLVNLMKVVLMVGLKLFSTAINVLTYVVQVPPNPPNVLTSVVQVDWVGPLYIHSLLLENPLAESSNLVAYTTLDIILFNEEYA